MVKFTEEIRDEIIVNRENGLPLKDCALLAGIDRTSLHIWIKKGKEAKSGLHRQFYLDMKKAEAKFKAYHLSRINKDPSWQSSAWALERLDPENFAKPEIQNNIQIQNENNNLIDNSNSDFDEDERRDLKKLAQSLSKSDTIE